MYLYIHNKICSEEGALQSSKHRLLPVRSPAPIKKFSKHLRKTLLRYFEIQPYPNVQEVREIARAMNEDTRTISRWFYRHHHTSKKSGVLPVGE